MLVSVWSHVYVCCLISCLNSTWPKESSVGTRGESTPRVRAHCIISLSLPALSRGMPLTVTCHALLTLLLGIQRLSVTIKAAIVSHILHFNIVVALSHHHLLLLALLRRLCRTRSLLFGCIITCSISFLSWLFYASDSVGPLRSAV